MTDQDAIKYLASSMGQMTVMIGARYRIQYNDNSGCFGFMPEYGETFDEALKNVVLAKFGENYLKIAEETNQIEMDKLSKLAKSFADQFASL